MATEALWKCHKTKLQCALEPLDTALTLISMTDRFSCTLLHLISDTCLHQMKGPLILYGAIIHFSLFAALSIISHWYIVPDNLWSRLALCKYDWLIWLVDQSGFDSSATPFHMRTRMWILETSQCCNLIDESHRRRTVRKADTKKAQDHGEYMCNAYTCTSLCPFCIAEYLFWAITCAWKSRH